MQEVWSLALDRSSAQPSMALFKGHEMVAEYSWCQEPARDSTWCVDIARIVQRCGIEPRHIHRFVCGLGPGSFSGIRAALAFIQGMALPEQREIIGIASASVLAVGHAHKCPKITVVGDARRNQLWSVTYLVKNDPPGVSLHNNVLPSHTDADFTLTSPDELGAAVPEDSWIVTPEWDRLRNTLCRLFPAKRLTQESVYPAAGNLGSLALAHSSASALRPLPIYLHPPVAQPSAGVKTKPLG